MHDYNREFSLPVRLLFGIFVLSITIAFVAGCEHRGLISVSVGLSIYLILTTVLAVYIGFPRLTKWLEEKQVSIVVIFLLAVASLYPLSLCVASLQAKKGLLDVITKDQASWEQDSKLLFLGIVLILGCVLLRRLLSRSAVTSKT